MTESAPSGVGPDGHFTVKPLPTKMIFGPGSRRCAGDALAEAGITRPLVLSTPRGREAAQTVAEPVGGRVVGFFDHARMHVPRATVDEALAVARELAPDGCLAVGGGSTIGLAKALARDGDLPYVAVPTTYAGSEMTSIWGITSEGVKTTGRDERVRPRTAVYDAELTATLGLRTSVMSGLNAVAHAAESLYAPDGSPFIDTVAQQAVSILVPALAALARDPTAIDVRANAFYGAALCGACLGSTAMSLHHKLCHVLGGAFDLPHAETHAAVLPHVLAFNLPAAASADRVLRQALGDDEPELVLWRLGAETPGRSALSDLRLRDTDIARAVDLTLKDLGSPQANPRVVTAEQLRTILDSAFRGDRPRRVAVS